MKSAKCKMKNAKWKMKKDRGYERAAFRGWNRGDSCQIYT